MFCYKILREVRDDGQLLYIMYNASFFVKLFRFPFFHFRI